VFLKRQWFQNSESMTSLPRLLSETDRNHVVTYTIPLMIIALILVTIVILFSTAVIWRRNPMTLSSTSKEQNSPSQSTQQRKLNFIDSSVPIIFQSAVPFWRRFSISFCSSHPWLTPFYPSAHSPSPLLRIFTLFTKICMVFFLNSLIYDYAESGYASCHSHGMESCDRVHTFLNVGKTMCEWSKDSLKCQPRDLNANILRLVFISVLLAVIHTPFWLLLQHLTFSRLGDIASTFHWNRSSSLMESYAISTPLQSNHSSSNRPTNDDNGNGTGDEENGFISKSKLPFAVIHNSKDLKSHTAQEFSELIQLIHTTAEKITNLNQRQTFLQKWKLFEEQNPIYQRLSLTLFVMNQLLPLLQSSSHLNPFNKLSLLFNLFIADLLPTPDFLVYWNQLQRQQYPQYPSSLLCQLSLWILFILSDVAMLIYCLDFWIRFQNSTNTQFAFFCSFCYWLVLELFLFHTIFYLWNHVVLLSRAHFNIFVAQDCAINWFLGKSCFPSPSAAAPSAASTSAAASSAAASSATSPGAAPTSGTAAVKVNRKTRASPGNQQLNAADYLFTSVRLVSMLSSPDLSASASASSSVAISSSVTSTSLETEIYTTLLSYHTLIPPEYDRSQTKFDQFLTTVVSWPLLKHDLLILPLLTTFSGGFVMLEIFLYRQNPFYVLFPFQALVIVAIFVLILSACQAVRISPESLFFPEPDTTNTEAVKIPQAEQTKPLPPQEKRKEQSPREREVLKQQQKREEEAAAMAEEKKNQEKPGIGKDQEEEGKEEEIPEMMMATVVPMQSSPSPLATTPAETPAAAAAAPAAAETLIQPSLSQSTVPNATPITPQSPASPKANPLPAVNAVHFASPPHRQTSGVQTPGSSSSKPTPPMKAYSSIQDLYSHRSDPYGVEAEAGVGSGTGTEVSQKDQKGAATARSFFGSLILPDE
jgi:hypothetical protein